MLALVRERLFVERLEDDLHLLLEQFAVGVVVDDGCAERLDFAAVVAAPHAEDDAPVGEDVRHGVVFSEAHRMPHGDDVERAAELQLLCLARKMRSHQNEVRYRFVTLALEVVLSHPERVEA